VIHGCYTVTPTIGVQHSVVKRKLIQPYFGPYKIVASNDPFFRIQLENCLKAPTSIIINDVAPLEIDLSYQNSNQVARSTRSSNETQNIQILQGAMELPFGKGIHMVVSAIPSC
jgi:hypothetical protein